MHGRLLILKTVSAATMLAVALVCAAVASAVDLDGRIEPPTEYVLHVAETRRAAGRDGLDMLVSVHRTAERYHIALRFPTTLTAEDIDSLGAFPVAIFTSARAADGSAVRVPVVQIPADWALDRKMEAANGVHAMRRLDARTGLLVVEISVPPALLTTARDGNLAVRIEVENRNGAHGNANTGRQTFPAADDGDAIGLGRLPADPRAVAAGGALDDLDMQLMMADADGDVLEDLHKRVAAARQSLTAGTPNLVRAEMGDYIDRIDALLESGRLGSSDAAAMKTAADTVLRILAE